MIQAEAQQSSVFALIGIFYGTKKAGLVTSIKQGRGCSQEKVKASDGFPLKILSKRRGFEENLDLSTNPLQHQQQQGAC